MSMAIMQETTDAMFRALDFTNAECTHAPPPLNRKYLRATHDHEPTLAVPGKGKATKSKQIALQKGNVILVHLTGANGWADGTVLSTGERGWFPAHYCEPYDHEHIRYFFHALTNFWTIGAHDNHPRSWRGTRKDEVYQMIFGVRHVLVSTPFTIASFYGS